MSGPAMREKTIRFPEEVLDELERRASVNRESVSDLVRRLIVDGLSDINRTQAVLDEVRELRRGVGSLREVVANLALVLLTRHSEEVYTLEEAQNWIKKTFLDDRP
jgi:predicted CopG family antitoxin